MFKQGGRLFFQVPREIQAANRHRINNEFRLKQGGTANIESIVKYTPVESSEETYAERAVEVGETSKIDQTLGSASKLILGARATREPETIQAQSKGTYNDSELLMLQKQSG